MVSVPGLGDRLRTRWLEATHCLQSLLVRRRLRGRGDALQAQIVHDLQTEGVHVTTIEQLLPESAPALHQSFRRALELLQAAQRKQPSRLCCRGSASNDLRAEAMLQLVPELYLFGLQPRIIALVQQYLRLPVAYHGAVVRHSLVDGVGAGPRLWHQDEEDFHVLRMVVYLNDVTVGGGPFEYIPRRLRLDHRRCGGAEGQLTNEQMRAVVSQQQWRRIYGTAGTVVVADSAQVFHHESLPTERERAVVMIGYASRRPKSVATSMAHFPVEDVSATLRRLVPPHYHPHVFGWRRAMRAGELRSTDALTTCDRMESMPHSSAGATTDAVSL